MVPLFWYSGTWGTMQWKERGIVMAAEYLSIYPVFQNVAEFDRVVIEEERYPNHKWEFDGEDIRDLGALNFAGGANEHADISSNIIVAMTIAIRAKNLKCRVGTSDKWLKLANARLLPDVMVNCTPQEKKAIGITDPSIIFEVISDGTEKYDLSIKKNLYEMIPLLHAYVVVATNEQQVRVFVKTAEGKFSSGTTYVAGDTITFTAPSVDMTVDDIYFGIPA